MALARRSAAAWSALAVAMTACLSTEFGPAPADSHSDASLDCPGAAGCACQTDSDCPASACLVTSVGSKCAGFCVQGSCAAGERCGAVTVAGGASGGQVRNGLCLPKWPTACTPCATDAECRSPGDAAASCVDPLGQQGGSGRFCGASCMADSDCPEGALCVLRRNAAGQDVEACVPASGACACSPWAVANAAQTPCLGTAAMGGSCSGVRRCTPAGLSACDAPEPQTETCNGADDDCDGSADDGAALCDDGNPCTADVCAGSAGCSHVATAGSCTPTDPCSEGGGSARTGCVSRRP